METNVMAPTISPAILDAIPMLIDFPHQRFHVNYDQEADVRYISFQRPQKATDSIMTDDGILMRYRNDELVGITILNASHRSSTERL